MLILQGDTLTAVRCEKPAWSQRLLAPYLYKISFIHHLSYIYKIITCWKQVFFQFLPILFINTDP